MGNVTPTVPAGEIIFQHTDFSVEVPGNSLTIERIYRSAKTDRIGWFGRGFRNRYEREITRVQNAIVETDSMGVEYLYEEDGAGGYLQEPIMGARGSRDGQGHFVSQIPGGLRFIYDLETGRLQKIRDINENGLDFVNYRANGVPELVLSTAMRSIALDVDPVSGLVRTVSLPDLTAFHYEYSDRDELIHVIDPLENRTDFFYSPDAAGLMVGRQYPGQAAVTWSYDPAGRVSSITNEAGGTTSLAYEDGPQRKRYLTDPLGKTTAFTLDSAGFPAEVTSPDGQTWKTTWSATGRVTAVESPDHKTWTYAYGPDGLLSSAQGPGGKTQSWTRNPSTGFETSRTNEDGTSVSAAFSLVGNLASLTDASGRNESFTHNSRGQVLTHHDAAGTTLSEYDAFGNLVRLTDALGHTTTRTFDPLGRVISTTDHLGRTSSTEYWLHGVVKQQVDSLGQLRLTVVDALYNPIITTDERGAVTRQSWRTIDGQVLLAQRIDALGNVWTYEHDAIGRVVAMVDPRGARTETVYDDAGRVVATRDALGFERQTVWNVDGTIHAQIDELGNPTTFLYDSYLRQERVVSPGGAVRRTRYDDRGRVVGQVDELGAETTLELDPDGRTLATIDANGARVEYTLDARGQVTKVKDARGSETSFVLDALGRQIEVRDAGGGIRKQFFDEVGRLYRTLDPLGREQRFEFDSLDRVVRAIGPEGQVAVRDYLPTGELRSETDPDGSTRTFSYDLLGRVVEEQDALGYRVLKEYDPVGNLVRLTDQNGNATQFSYDLRGLLVSVTDAQGRTVQHTYDAARRKISTTNARNQTCSFSYDPDSRLVSKACPEETETYVYDEAGRRVRKTSSTVDELTFYDPAGRETGRLDTARGFALSHGLDAVGNPTTSTDSLGRTILRTFDPVNRLATLASQAGSGFAMSYNLAGQLVQRSSEARGIESYTYDPSGRVKTLQVRKFSDQSLVIGFEYFYSPASDRVREIETRSGGVSVETVYEYNARHELTRALVTSPGGAGVKGYGELTWTYDPAGNRLTQTRDGTPQNLIFDTLNQIAAIDGRPAQHDADGNMLREPLDAVKTRIYEWDSQNRMTRTAVAHGSPGNEVLEDIFTYRYDPDSMRVASIEEPDASAPSRPRNIEQRFLAAGQIVEDRRYVEGQQATAQTSRRFVRQGNHVLEELRDSIAGSTLTTAGSLLYLQDIVGSTIGQIETTPGTPGTLDPITRASVNVNGAQANGPTFDPVISADGRFVAFLAFPQTNNLAPGDTNGQRDVYLKDRQTGAVERISAPVGAEQFDQGDGPVKISGDGRYVLFTSFAYNPWPFVRASLTIRDRQLNTSTPLVGGDYSAADLSDDGLFIALLSNTNYGSPQDLNNAADVYVYSISSGAFDLVSRGPQTVGGNHGAFGPPSISSDGRYVAFSSSQSLVTTDINGFNDIYVKDRQNGTMVLASTTTAGVQANGHSANPSISANGRWVAFQSTATNLAQGDSRFNDVFLKDLVTGVLIKVSEGQGSNFSGEAAVGPVSISDDGRFVTYTANDLANQVPGDNNAADDVFLLTRDVATSSTTRISVTTSGGQANSGSGAAAMSGDGRWISFVSSASNLVPNDTNGQQDVFVTPNPILGGTGGPPTVGAPQLASYAPYGEQMSGPSARFAFTGLANESLGGATDSLLAATYRSYRPGLGRWTQRDPAGPVDGPNLNWAMGGNPLRWTDPTGLLIIGLAGGFSPQDLWEEGFEDDPNILGGSEVLKAAIDPLLAERGVKERVQALRVGDVPAAISKMMNCPSDEPIIIFGYSRGATMAADAAQFPRQIGRTTSLLVTIDPVSARTWFWNKIKRQTGGMLGYAGYQLAPFAPVPGVSRHVNYYQRHWRVSSTGVQYQGAENRDVSSYRGMANDHTNLHKREWLHRELAEMFAVVLKRGQ